MRSVNNLLPKRKKEEYQGNLLRTRNLSDSLVTTIWWNYNIEEYGKINKAERGFGLLAGAANPSET